MATIQRRPNSPFWQLCFRDMGTGRRLMRATAFHWNNRSETRAARELEAKATFEESQALTPKADHQWQTWVRPFLSQHYHRSPKTLLRYLTSWKTVEEFLLEKGIATPALVIHQTPQAYVTWRRGARKGGRKAKKKQIADSTISSEVKAWRIVMKEAIKRGWAKTNHCCDLGLKRTPTREMRALSLEEENLIRDALANGIPERTQKITQTNQHGRVFTYDKIFPKWERAEWMERSFSIAMAQGCRFSETRMPLSRINLKRGTILIHGKGGKVFTTALNPVLVPLIKGLKEAGETMTWDLPPVEFTQCSRQWTRLFRRLGIKDFWFHCTRATAITRAHEMEVSFPKAMKFFGHAGALVHAIYTRLGTEDVSSVAAALASYASSRCNPSNGNGDALPATLARAPKSSDADTRSGSPQTSLRSRISSARSSQPRAGHN